ncbi:MAG: hypothetical protein WCP30_01050 [Mycobacteriaceae bacterium]
MEPVYRGIEIAAATAARALGTSITYQGMEAELAERARRLAERR